MRRDILVDEAGNPLTAGGDFVVGPSDAQHIHHLAVAEPGHYINAPLMGVGLRKYLKAGDSPQNRQALLRDFRLQAQADGYAAQAVKISIPTLSSITVEVEGSTVTLNS